MISEEKVDENLTDIEGVPREINLMASFDGMTCRKLLTPSEKRIHQSFVQVTTPRKHS